MAKRNRGEDAPIEEVNLTPMIDVTFQLLIFFLVCTELAKLDDVEGLLLPRADAARPDENPSKDRLVINIALRLDENNNKIPGSYRYVVGGKDRTPAELSRLLAREALWLTKKGKNYSNCPVLIRADADVEYKYVQEVMKMCVDQKIWKLSFAALNPQE